MEAQINNSLEKKKLISAAVISELNLHPKATLVDIYKFFFQDEFGPGHLIDKPESALEYIKEELNDSLEYDKILLQEVGFKKNFIRVNLSLVKDSIISIGQLTDALIKSANSIKSISINEWIKEWEFILDVVTQMNILIPNFESDKIFLGDLLKQGKVVVHHSEVFNKAYNPHYRLIAKVFIDNLELKGTELKRP